MKMKIKKIEYYKGGEIACQLKGTKLTYYYKNGKIRAKGSFANGEMYGKWVFYRETGQLWVIGHLQKNLKHGEWLTYDRKDKLEKREKFVNGKPEKKTKTQHKKKVARKKPASMARKK